MHAEIGPFQDNRYIVGLLALLELLRRYFQVKCCLLAYLCILIWNFLFLFDFPDFDADHKQEDPAITKLREAAVYTYPWHWALQMGV